MKKLVWCLMVMFAVVVSGCTEEKEKALTIDRLISEVEATRIPNAPAFGQIEMQIKGEVKVTHITEIETSPQGNVSESTASFIEFMDNNGQKYTLFCSSTVWAFPDVPESNPGWVKITFVDGKVVNISLHVNPSQKHTYHNFKD